METVDPQRTENDDPGSEYSGAVKSGANDPLLYVGIGASAGGLEALCDFFDALPADTGCAFIVVQHLSPDFKSVMNELLAKHTNMTVETVFDGVQVLANSVYLIPARKNLMLAEGKLYLADQMQNQGVNLPIDVFFRSLAESANEKSVAIILSGTGSDGSRGIKSIKESGGLILVQDPTNAKFDGMPNSAVYTGLADFSLSAAGIAENLSAYAKHPHIADAKQPLNSRFENESDVLKRIFDLLRQEGHIDFSLYKSSTVARRIEQRIGINQLHTLREYLNLLEESVKEVQTLGRELLINVTRFFRDKEAFKFVEERVASRIVQKAMDGQEIRVWVAGCSTGEEPYSLAIVFDEAIRKSEKDLRLKLFATDVDSDAIAEASAGQYSIDIINDVSPERIQRYFLPIHDGYEVRPDLRQTVVFAHHNMISDPPFSNIDFISCRNTLIYFQHAAQKKVISSFHFSLKPDASVFFGSSESIGELKSHFKSVHERHRIYKKISNVKLPLGNVIRSSDGGSTSQQRLGIPPVSNLLRNYRVTKTQDSGFEHVKDRLINNFGGSCIVLNSDHQAVHVYGDAAKYMNAITSGRVSTRIQDLILPELTVALDTALARAKSEGKAVIYDNIPVQVNGEQSLISMQTEYFESEKDTPSYSSLTIHEAAPAGANRRDIESYDISEQTSQRIRDLENDVLHKQEHLQVTNEELETTNEELQSSNEELMSSNEELQSTNEELQSVNEELFTVNNEFQEKISELTLANDDLDNVLLSTAVGIVFLDQEVRIRRITDVARRFFNVLPSDIGRPLDHISHDLKYPTLFEDIRRVVITQRSIFKEVFSIAGEFVQVKLMAYKASDKSASRGCIVAITDLSHRKLSEQERLKKDERKRRASENRGRFNNSGLNVLVIDDQETDRLAIERYLKQIEMVPINVLFADSITEALTQLDNTDVDVCLLDYRLDPNSENDFIQQAKIRQHSVPVIVISGLNREQIKEQLPLNDMALFIQKSELSPLVLELSIKHALGSSVGISDSDG